MDVKTALNKVEALCSRQEYCRSDIRKKLIKWDISPDNIEKILVSLIEEKFIDENRYANFFVRDKFKFNRWGRKKIWWQLKQKEVPPEIIEEALKQINKDEYTLTLEDVIKEKLRQVKNKEPIKQKAAIIRNAVSKGYEYQEVIPIVEQLLLKND
ncbi:regulatory protein RecX [Marinilabilia rubra]|uniref:Regulatory protein RecX n=1 Tax=Marinilabilia rubra TaxID=2162893 RepID=A0A2U2BDJ6_9BACT|nr:regulatory protein RecX [Marinilabilia rubra]PWE01145.1 RecX family transcriptional regulator [Marinilabilia rubra]